MVTQASLDEALIPVLAGDPEAVRDPFPSYARLREHGAVYWYDDALPIVSTFADVRSILRDDARFQTRRGAERVLRSTHCRLKTSGSSSASSGSRSRR